MNKSGKCRLMASIPLIMAATISLAGCGSKTETEAGAYKPGTYTATAQGYGGEIQAKVTVDENAITKVELTGDLETEGIGSKAIEELPDKIVAANKSSVDAVSGATVTSDAVMEAVEAALSQAGGE